VERRAQLSATRSHSGELGLEHIGHSSIGGELSHVAKILCRKVRQNIACVLFVESELQTRRRFRGVRVDAATDPSVCAGPEPRLPQSAGAVDGPTESAPVSPPALPDDLPLDLPQRDR
jgi:hypothetical protein